MLKRNGTDTWVGFIPGADIDEGTGATKGGLAKAPAALAKLFGWKGVPILGGYTYPAGGTSETWDFQKAQGFAGPVGYKSFAIPNGHTIDDVHAGNCDAIWTVRAQTMVLTGQGEGIYEPGYEGADKNFNGSAGQVVPTNTLGSVQVKQGSSMVNVMGSANWAYAVNRQINIMRKVQGWDPWINLNYDVNMATAMGLDPDPFRLFTEKFQSIGTELYPLDDFSGGWTAKDNPDKLLATMQKRLAAQQVACKKYGVPIGLGETAPMIRTDTHASGDDPNFVAFLHDYAMNLTNNVAFFFLYNGTTGDTSRFALWNQTTGTYTVDNAKFPKAAAAIKQLLDPANFVNRVPLNVIYTQAQYDAAIAAQQASDGLTVTALQGKLDALTKSLSDANAALTTAYNQLSTSQAQLAIVQPQLDAANALRDASIADLQKVKDAWHAFTAMMG